MNPESRTRIDKHVIAAYATHYRTIAGGVFELTHDWARGFSGVKIPTFNVFLPLSEGGLKDETLADTAAFFASKNVVYAIELIHDRFPHGPTYLNERYYQSLPPQPAMALMGALKEVTLNSTVTIERVKNVPQIAAFCTILNEVFDFDLSNVIKLFPVAYLAKSNIGYFHHYLAFVNDEPAAAGTIICKDGVASIWNLSTLDKYRRMGVATTLLHKMLSQVAQDGSDLTMLYSTPQAYHLFTRFGFEIYTQRQWFLPPGLYYED